jgi:hypothetical protein
LKLWVTLKLLQQLVCRLSGNVRIHHIKLVIDGTEIKSH